MLSVLFVFAQKNFSYFLVNDKIILPNGAKLALYVDRIQSSTPDV